MAGRTTWLVDGSRFASKIKNASGSCNLQRLQGCSNPTRACPNCNHVIDNSDVGQEWPGLPRGVKFDPTDPEIMWHLLSKNGVDNLKPHPFTDEFIPTVDRDDGICYTHPQNLPGVKQDGSVSHFFHRAIKAYNSGNRKRRKIHGEESCGVRWHKTGRTKPVILDGVQRGCKKIMVLYVNMVKGEKAEKTNWVMHQYHLGTQEDERDGEYVISKIFYQQQQTKQGDKIEQDFPETCETPTKVDPVTPMSVTPVPARYREAEFEQIETPTSLDPLHQHLEYEIQPEHEIPCCDDQLHGGNHGYNTPDNNNHDNDYAEDESKWWDGGSQCLLNSQQLAEGLSLCEDLLQSQSPNREANGNDESLKTKSRLPDYVQLGAEHLKKDLEECQNLELDPANIELDTPPDFSLSQLEFASQDSFIAWGGGKVVD